MGRQSRGNSLLETVSALFLLAAAAILLLSLFHTALKRSRWSQHQNQARVIAEKTLHEIRSWSAQGGYVTASDLDSWNGRSFSDALDPAYRVEVAARPAGLWIPCRSLEAAYPAANQRTLNGSAALVEVVVGWEGGRGALSRLRLAGLVPESPRNLARVDVTGDNGPIAAGATITLTATALDDQNRPIQDIVFSFWVESTTGNGQCTTQRSGRSCLFTNRGRRSDGTTFQSAGTCRVGALGSYEGKEVIGYSNDLQLLP